MKQIAQLVCRVLAVAGLGLPGHVVASVEYDARIPQLAFAAQELDSAFKKVGRNELEVALAIAPDASSPESFKVRNAGSNKVEVSGSDATGAMYGGLEVAGRIKLGLPIKDMEGKPFIAKRGIKFNIPLDARTPSYDDTGDSAQDNIETMWDFGFWKVYLDDLARYRYNVLSLWSTHPYPSMVKLKDYPDVALDDVYRIGVPMRPEYKNKLQDLDQNGDGQLDVEHDAKVLKLVKKMTIDEKVAHWQRVFQYARDRGIEIYLFNWNVFTFGATGKDGITQNQTNDTTIDYLRQSVRQALLDYPQIAGIGVTAGENADEAAKGKYSTENFIFNTYGRAIMDAKKEQPDRQIRFIFRRHVTDLKKVQDAFKDYTGGVLDISTKYSVAHMYSSRRPQEWEKRIVDEGWLDAGFKVWLNLRNDDFYMLRWGGADYARDFIKWMPREHIPGFYMGSDGYVCGRDFFALDPKLAGRLEIDKNWYQFRLWGQLAYDNELGRDYWEAVLKQRFTGVDAKRLYDAWGSVSEIIPQLNRSVWAPTDADFEAEGCMQRSGFLTVDDYQFDRDPMVLNRIDNPPDPQCISVKAWAKDFLAGKKPKGVTPLQVADNLDGYAAAAQSVLPALRKQADSNAELRETLNDIDAMACLGRYYADKMRGAAKLAVFREGGRKDKKFIDEAVAHLKDAVEDWKAYAAILSTQYKPQLTARTSYLDWNSTLKDVEKEVDTVAREGDIPEVRFANLSDGAKLPANAGLTVEVDATDKDGIKKVKLYLNGLLLVADKTAMHPYAWNGASDDLLKALKSGAYLLAAVAEDNTGVSGRSEIRIAVGNAPNNSSDDWENEIHQVVMNDGDRIMGGKVFEFPRLESELKLTKSGSLELVVKGAGPVFKTRSKDADDVPHYAEFKNGQLTVYRGKPGNPGNVVLWESKKPKEDGPFKLGVKVGNKLVAFTDSGGNRKVVWSR